MLTGGLEVSFSIITFLTDFDQVCTKFVRVQMPVFLDIFTSDLRFPLKKKVFKFLEHEISSLIATTLLF